MNIKNLLGKRIQEVRKAQHLTQEKLAELVGLDVSSISNIENGKYYPTAENLDKILTILKIEPSDLFNFSHHIDHEIMIEEMVSSMKKNEKLVILMYKFYNSIKF